MYFLGALLFIGLLVFLYEHLTNVKIEKRFKSLPETTSQWNDLFPNQSERIKTFLNIFAHSFALDTKYSNRLSPSDHINVIYDQIYSQNPLGDFMEHASLFTDLENTFNIEFPEDLDQSITLQELYAYTKNNLPEY